MALLKTAGLHITTDKLRPIPSPRYQRRYEVGVSDRRSLELVLAPFPMARLLRSERCMVNSEAAVVRWIHDVVSHDKSHGPSAKAEGNVTLPGSTSNYDGHLDGDPDLSDLLPKLVHHCPASKESATPYSIFQRRHGAAVGTHSGALTDRERSHVDFQKGRLARRLSKLESPSGRFGLAVAVLAASHLPKQYGEPPRGPASSGAAHTWSAAFHSMLEGILRDGEDMAVTIAYSAIRKHFRRLSHLLDSVTIPRLVIIDGGEQSNVLVTRTTEMGDDIRRGRQLGVGGSSGTPESSDDDTDDVEVDDNNDDDDDSNGQRGHEGKDAGNKGEADHQGREGGETEPGTKKQRIQVTGLRDWSNCVFGDPLFARAFSDDPSDAFLQGFYGSLPAAEHTTPDEDDGPVEDERNSGARLLLYQAYHATVCIVREFYGQRTDRSRMELAARKRLSEILAQLDGVTVEPKRGHRRPSGEMSPAKKLRQSPDEVL